MIEPGTRFRITHRQHWAYGRKVWICSDLPPLEIPSSGDYPALVWSRGELIEFQTFNKETGIIDSHVVPREWCQEVVDSPEPVSA